MFSIELMQELEVAKNQEADLGANVGMLARPKQSLQKSFPNINIVTMPGAYNASKLDPDLQLKRLLESYALVGIKNPKVETKRLCEIGPRSAFFTTLTYLENNQLFTSSVTIVSGLSRHYIITYIDKAENFATHRLEANRMIKSFLSWADQTTAQSTAQDNKENETETSFQYWPWISLAILALIFLSSFLSALYCLRAKIQRILNF